MKMSLLMSSHTIYKTNYSDLKKIFNRNKIHLKNYLGLHKMLKR